MYKFFLYISSLLLAGHAYAQKPTDTFKLFFDLGVPTLNQKMQKKIDLLIYNDKIIHGSSVTIVGYADYLGGNTYNKALSMKRAENVKDYLVNNGINEKDISLCIGRGKIDREGMTSNKGYPTDRRVDIVMNNSTEKFIAKNTHAPKPQKKDSVRRKAREVSNLEELKRMKAGSLFKLPNVYFLADRHVMTPESEGTLEKLAQVLKDNPSIKISIEGHVCCRPDLPDIIDADTYEPTLSVNRAKAIYTYLVENGIDAGRLTYKGFGRSRPVIEIETSEEEAEKNRRVEVRVIQN